MKKAKLLFGVCVLGLILSGCNEAITPSNQNTSQHEHLFSTEWVYDAENHWHESTCGHNVTSGKAKHIFKTEVIEPTSTAKGYTKYICEICGYNYKGDETNPVSNISVPTGLSYASASKTLEWNIVSGATSYVVSVDNRERASSTNYFDVTSLGLSNGEHTAKVKAVNANLSKESAYSDSIAFNYSGATSNPGGNSLDNISLSEPKTVIQSRTSPVALNEMVSYRDDYYYYFVFDLGKYFNIPVDTPYGYCSYGGVGNVTRTMTATSAKANTIQESSNRTQQTTTTFSETGSVNLNITAGYQPPSPTGGVKFEMSLEVGYSVTVGNSSADSWSRTFTEASEYSESESNSTSISFKTGDPAGNYYYYFSIDTQVYGVIARDINTKEFFVTTTSSVIGRGFNYLYAGENSGLNITCDDILDFDCSIIERLGLDKIVPSNYVGNKVDDGKTHVANVSELYTALSEASASDSIVMDKDIDCANYPWMPINNFNGIFDGNGFAIKNLSFEYTNGGDETKYGIFKELNGTFTNVTIKNADFNVHKYHDTQNYLYAGVVCGRLTGGTISRVNIEGKELYAYHDSDNKTLKIHAHVGGFVGELVSGSIKNCNISSINIYGKARINYDKNSTADVWCYVGGFVGHQAGGTIDTVVRSNDVIVTSHTISGSKTSAYHCFVGGIIGYKDGGTYSNCASTDTNLNKNPEVVVNGSANTSNSGKGAITGN